MRRRIVWSDSARADYLAAVRYTAERNPDAAASLGELATGRPGRVKGTYEKVVAGLPYIIAYEIMAQPEGGEIVAILHVIHGARDWPAGGWPKD